MVVFTRGRTQARRDELRHGGGEPLRTVPLVVLTSQAQRERLRDRGRRHPGPRPRAHRGRDDLRQGPRADDHAAAQRARLCAGPHHRPLLHALGTRRSSATTARPPSRTTSPPRTARPATRGGGEAKLTDAGRKVYGGDGITPDFCVERRDAEQVRLLPGATPGLRGLLAQLFGGGDHGQRAEIAGTGKRSEVSSAKVRVVGARLPGGRPHLAEFKAFLDKQKLRYTPEDIAANREAISHQVTRSCCARSSARREARRRSMAWDPQVRKALELVPKSETLLKDPQKFIAERVAESRPVAVAPPQ